MPRYKSPSKLPSPSVSKKTLQRLRRAAGYRTAKDFAAVLDIPASTYARYETQPETPESSIPLRAAWLIADSIDLVVGRQDVDAPTKTWVEEAYESLTDENRWLLREYIQFLQHKQTNSPS